MPKVVEMMKEGGDKNLELYHERMEHTEVVIQWQRKRGLKLDQLSKLRVTFLGSFDLRVSRLCEIAKSTHGWGERRSYSIRGPNPSADRFQIKHLGTRLIMLLHEAQRVL